MEDGAAGGERPGDQRETGAIPKEPKPGTVPGQVVRPGKRSCRNTEGEQQKIVMEVPKELAAEDVLAVVERVLAMKIREDKGANSTAADRVS